VNHVQQRMKEVNAHMKKITFKFVSKNNIYSYQAYESCLVSITSVGNKELSS
jgi:hypothetical protein